MWICPAGLFTISLASRWENECFRNLCHYFEVNLGASFEEISREAHFASFFADLQKLCSTLATVNLCEMAEVEDRTSASRSSTTTTPTTMATLHSNPPSISSTSSSGFNSTMISGTSHLNELQKENRAPPPRAVAMSSPNALPLPSALRSSPSVLSNASPSPPVAMTSTITPYHYQV